MPIFALVLPLLFTLSGCSSGFDATKTLQVQLSTEPVSLDPALAEDGVSMRVIANIMDGLVGYDGDGELVNRLAESVEVQDAGKRYVFKLRPTKWSDGKPVVADDFVFGILRALNPSTGSKMASGLFPIRGAKDFHAGTGKAESVGVRVEKGDLVMELERPTSYFLKLLSTSVSLPVRKDVLEKHQGKWTREWPVTGPYRIARHKADREMLLEANPEYWKAGDRVPVLFRVVLDESTGANLFEEGKLDILTRVPSLDFERFKAQGGLHVDPFLATYYLAFNVRKKPFDDREWRKAFAGVIRRDEIVTALGTGEKPASSWIPAPLEGNLPFEDPLAKFAGAVAAIKKKVVTGKIPPIAIQFDSSSRNALVLEKVQQDVKKALGITVALKQLDWKSHIRAMQTDPENIYRFGWLSAYGDPIPHLEVFKTGSANNYTGWSNAEYDRLVTEVAALSPGPERVDRIHKAQALLVDQEVVLVPIYHYIQTHAVAPRVKGFRVNPFGVIRFEELSITGR